jgi:dTDP-4-dehydrorhamnose reductase
VPLAVPGGAILMQILLTGKNGQLGWELQRTLTTLGNVTALSHAEIDLEQPESIRVLVRKERPHLIVNAAAYTAVDMAESEKDRAWKVNAIAPGILAEEARRVKAAFIHYSTDYVFDGQKGTSYVESDVPNPINSYGRSKQEGERLVQNIDDAYIILRTSWVYSLRQQGGFVNKVLEWAHQRQVLRVVEDQIGSPTWARVLAEVTTSVAANGEDHLYDYFKSRRGIYHAAGKGAVSRLEWAQAILRHDPAPTEQRVQRLEGALSSEFPTPAARPAYSALNCDRFEATFNLRIPNWDESLQLAMGVKKLPADAD